MSTYGTLPTTTTATSHSQQVLSWREKLGEKLENQKFHLIVLGLTLIDALCVLIQIFFTFFHECQAPLMEPRHWLIVAFELAEMVSLFICVIFGLEILLSLIAFGPKYYLPGWPHWKLHIFDAAVVTTTFILEFILKGKEREVAGLLIVFRLWRIVKVIEAVILSVSFTNEEELDKLREKYARLEAMLKTEQEKNAKLEQQME